MELEIIQKALITPLQNRNHKQQQAIQNYFSQYQYFQKLTKNKRSFIQLCRVITVQKMKQGQTVFFKGDWPQHFYIIISGEIHVLIPKDNEAIYRQKEKYKLAAKNIDSKLRILYNKKRQIKGFENMNIQQRKLSFIASQKLKFQKEQLLEIESVHTDEDDSDSDESDIQEKSKRYSILDKQSTSDQLSNLIQVPTQFQNVIKDHSRLSIVSNQTVINRISVLQQNKTKKSFLQNFSKLDGQDILELQIPELNNELCIGDLDFPERYFQDGIFKYQSINKLYSQQTFGQNGLLLNQSRSATILCSKDCIFGLVSKDNYNKILLEIEQKKLEKKALLIKQGLQVEAPLNHLIQLGNCFHKIKPPINTYLFIEGEKPKEAYLIKKGDVQLLKVSQEYQKNKDEEDQIKKHKSGSGIQPLIKFVQLALVSTGDMIGHLDLLLNYKRKYSAQVTSANTTIYYTDKYQLKQQLNDIAFSKTKIIIQAKLFNDILFENYKRFEQIQQDAQQKQLKQDEIEENKLVQRVQVKDIDNFYKVNNDKNQASRMIRHQASKTQNYAGDIAQKLKRITWLSQQFHQETKIDNDDYLNIFDKAKIEKKSKQIKLRKRILADGKKFDELDEKIKQKILHDQSTYSKIKQKLEVEKGEWKRNLIRSSSTTKSNKNFIRKVYKDIGNMKSEDSLNILQLSISNGYLQNNAEIQSIQREVDSEFHNTQVVKNTEYVKKRPQTPLCTYMIGNIKDRRVKQVLRNNKSLIMSNKSLTSNSQGSTEIKFNLIGKKIHEQ